MSTLIPPVVYLVRHASPNRSTGVRYDVPPGPPILPKGEEEARRVGEFLREAGVGQLYVSPMQRTQQTARIAAEAGGDIPWTLDESITEWTRGETDETVLARMKTGWQQAWEESQESGPVAIVSHGGPIRVLVEHFGVEKELIAHYTKQFDYGNPMPPAGIWRVTRAEREDAWAVELVFTPEPFKPFPREEAVPAAAAVSYPVL